MSQFGGEIQRILFQRASLVVWQQIKFRQNVDRSTLPSDDIDQSTDTAPRETTISSFGIRFQNGEKKLE